MNYKKLLNRRIFVLCTDINVMRKAINFLRYKKFDFGNRHSSELFVGMGLYICRDEVYKVMYTSNRGILQDNNDFDCITDVSFMRYNKLSILDKLRGKPFGYIEDQEIKY